MIAYTGISHHVERLPAEKKEKEQVTGRVHFLSVLTKALNVARRQEFITRRQSESKE